MVSVPDAGVEDGRAGSVGVGVEAGVFAGFAGRRRRVRGLGRHGLRRLWKWVRDGESAASLLLGGNSSP